jgi:hypothetical protein
MSLTIITLFAYTNLIKLDFYNGADATKLNKSCSQLTYILPLALPPSVIRQLQHFAGYPELINDMSFQKE